MAGQGYCYGCGNQFAAGVFANPGSSGAGRLWLAPPPVYGYEPPRPTAEGFDAAKFFTFNGRIDRGTYWIISIIGIVVVFACLFMLGSQVSGLAQVIAGVIALVCYWMMLAANVKRWHDRDKSGAWIFISLVPFIGGIWAFIETGLMPGTVGKNSFGWPSDGSPFGE
jgi:uncharacterized membrane protein YhaH (DUF805 family)